MEIAGITVAATQLAGVADAAAKLAKALWIVYRDNGAIAKDVNLVRFELETAKETITLALETLRDVLQGNEASQVRQYFHQHRILRLLDGHANAVTFRMKSARASLDTKHSFRHKITWVLSRQTEIRQLLPSLQFLSICLGVVVESVKLRIQEDLILRDSPMTAYLKKENRRLEKQLIQREDTIKRLLPILKDSLKGMYQRTYTLHSDDTWRRVAEEVTPIYDTANALIDALKLFRETDSASQAVHTAQQSSASIPQSGFAAQYACSAVTPDASSTKSPLIIPQTKSVSKTIPRMWEMQPSEELQARFGFLGPSSDPAEAQSIRVAIDDSFEDNFIGECEARRLGLNIIQKKELQGCLVCHDQITPIHGVAKKGLLVAQVTVAVSKR